MLDCLPECCWEVWMHECLLLLYSYRPHLKDGERYYFQLVCQFTPGRGGVPLSVNRGTPSGPDGGYPHPSQWGVPPGLDEGTLLLELDRVPPPIGIRCGHPPPVRTGWYTPHQLGDRAAERALATRWAVCLLRSRRRTFLLV